ncbi:MAG TPA: hypothetical protein VFC86_07710 [Planctomycetota bacterium]|nr:hypothetical protein [Planctomycetota bacterium]
MSECLPESELRGLEFELPGLDLREIEDVVDDRQQGDGGGLHHAEVVALLRRQFRVERQLDHPDDAVHRRADLVAHVRQELALRQRGLFGRLLGVLEMLLGFPQLRRPGEDLLLDPAVRLLELGATPGDVLHLADAAEARGDEEQVDVDHPAGVFEPPPGAGREDAEDRLRPEDAAEQVVQGDDHGGGDEHLPVPVEGEERQGAEDVEVRLDAAARQVDQEGREEHLARRDDVARQDPAGLEDGERDGQRRDRAAEDQRRPHVHVRLADRPFPRAG